MSQRPNRREKHEWLENAAMFGIAIAEYTVTFPIVVYVHENASQWEAPLVFLSLGLGGLPLLWYWRARRHGWVAGILSSLLLIFSFGLAVFNGWKDQAVLAVNIVAISFAAFMFVWFHRIVRHHALAMRKINEEIYGDPRLRTPVVFRDDGERITVYPRRWRLIVQWMLEAALLAGIGVVFVLVKPDNLVVDVALAVLGCMLFYAFAATLYRMVVRRPSLIVGRDGILDNSLFISSGVGLIRWDEILSVRPTSRKSGMAHYHYLAVDIIDYAALQRRQSVPKRLILSMNFLNMSPLLMGQWALETPVGELAEQVDRYVETHAPPGFVDREDDTHDLFMPRNEDDSDSKNA